MNYKKIIPYFLLSVLCFTCMLYGYFYSIGKEYPEPVKDCLEVQMNASKESVWKALSSPEEEKQWNTLIKKIEYQDKEQIYAYLLKDDLQFRWQEVERLEGKSWKRKQILKGAESYWDIEITELSDNSCMLLYQRSMKGDTYFTHGIIYSFRKGRFQELNEHMLMFSTYFSNTHMPKECE